MHRWHHFHQNITCTRGERGAGCYTQTTLLHQSAGKVCLGQSDTCPHALCVELKLHNKRHRGLSDTHSHNLLCILQTSDDRQLHEYPHAYCADGLFCYHMWPRFGAKQYGLSSELLKLAGENYQVPSLRVSCHSDNMRQHSKYLIQSWPDYHFRVFSGFSFQFCNEKQTENHPDSFQWLIIYYCAISWIPVFGTNLSFVTVICY